VRHLRPLAFVATIGALALACPPLAARADATADAITGPATTNAPAAGGPAVEPDDATILKRQIEELKARTAVHERELLMLESRLEALEGGRAMVREAVLLSGGSALPASTGQVAQKRESSVDAAYLQQNALFKRGLTLTPSLSQSYATSRFFTLNGFLALGAIFLGNADVSQQKSSQTAFNMNATYGLNNRTQISLNAPYLHRTTTYSTVGAGYAANQASEATVDYGGLGDISGGLFYQVARERGNSPNVVANLQFSAPTGRGPFGIKNASAANNNNLIYPSTLPTGQGVWGISTGVSLIKTIDPAVLYGGANFYYYLPGKFRDISADENMVSPGYAQPGHAFSINFGTAFALNDRTSISLGYQQIVSGATRLRTFGAPWQKIMGTSLNAGMLQIGTSYTTSDRRAWVTQLGIGVTQDAPNVQLNLQLPHRI
jgi:hypothetical protein